MIHIHIQFHVYVVYTLILFSKLDRRKIYIDNYPIQQSLLIQSTKKKINQMAANRCNLSIIYKEYITMYT